MFLSVSITNSVVAVLLAGAVPLADPTPANHTPERQSLQTVSYVDLPRYMGTWYEIARTPNRFEAKCKEDVMVHYELAEDGKLSLGNQCRLQNGNLDTAHARGNIVDTVTRSKLRVTFFWPFYADYWIIYLDKDYRYAVVGEPDRKYLWIISRTPKLDAETYQQILNSVADHGYDVSRIIKTPQTETATPNLRQAAN